MSATTLTRATGKRTAPRRLRRTGVLVPLPKAEVPYARRRKELKGLTPGQIVALVMKTDAWKLTVGRKLEVLDRQRFDNPHKPGPEPLYSSVELEAVYAFKNIAGHEHAKQARNSLTSDTGKQCRIALGFDRPRNRKHTKVEGTDGVPSEATLSRHLRRFPEDERLALYGELFDLLNQEHLAKFPEAVVDAAAANIDGSTVKITGVAPVKDPASGEITNDKTRWVLDVRTGKKVERNVITARDAGYVGKGAPEQKQGHGYNFVAMFGARGVPMTRPHATALNESEKPAALVVLEDFERGTLPHLPADHITILTGDGAFNSNRIRCSAQRKRVVMNTHFVSHKTDDPATAANVKKRDLFRYRIDRYPNWRANGHRELACVCGKGTTSKRIGLSKTGKLVIRTEGECASCGSISITAGKWRLARNPDRFVPCDPSDPNETPDWAFGNPLTFHDANSTELGKRRHGSNENVYSMLEGRWALLRGRRSFRRKEQVELEATVIFCAMHVVAMEYRERVRRTPSSPELARSA